MIWDVRLDHSVPSREGIHVNGRGRVRGGARKVPPHAPRKGPSNDRGTAPEGRRPHPERPPHPPEGPVVVSCRLKVTLPKELWLRTFTVNHPEVRLDVLDRLELDGGATLFEVQIQPGEGGRWREEIRSLPRVEEVELIEATESSAVFRVYYRGRTFVPILKRLKLLRHFPFPVRNGVAAWTVVGPEDKVRELLNELAHNSTGLQLEAIHRGPPPRRPTLLTPRQEEILRQAMTEGYFDVPRRISLTDLAEKLGLAISTLSVTLAVIEKKIVEMHS